MLASFAFRQFARIKTDPEVDLVAQAMKHSAHVVMEVRLQTCGSRGSLLKITDPSTPCCASQILLSIFKVVIFEDARQLWSLSRPTLPLLLVHQDMIEPVSRR